MLEQGEEWKVVDGWEGMYEVSSLGRVRRTEGSRWKGSKPDGLLTLTITKGGYRVVCLCNRGERQRFVHTLVNRAFNGPPPSSKHVTNHKDFNKSNNVPSNLEWVTPFENFRHALLGGRIIRTEFSLANREKGRERLKQDPTLRPRGSKVGGAKLTEDIVSVIRWKLEFGVSYMRLASDYGVASQTIRNIATGKTWKHVSVCEHYHPCCQMGANPPPC